MARAASAPKKEISMEEALWKSADKLRGSVEPAEYKHVVLSLFFLKFASDKFEAQRKAISEKYGEKFVDNVAFYTKDNVFFLPEISRWSFIMENAKQDDIALKIDTALYTIEKANPALKGALPDNYYSRLHIDTAKLASLLDEIDKINTGDKENDIIGRVYEYFLSKFALAEGKGKGEFYTPKCIVNLIAEMIEPYDGILYDPCCGSGGMFVQSMKFVEAHHGNKKKVSIYGQEYTNTTYKLCKMNLAIRGISANLGEMAANTFTNDQHKDLKADYIMANPPFNQKEWRGDNELIDDPRWDGYEVPPTSNANYGWILNIVSKLSQNGVAGFLLANGALSDDGTELKIRRQLIENNLVEAIIILPRNLFYTTDISVTLWILNKNKKARVVEENGEVKRFRNREREILFMDLRQMGSPYEKKYIELTEEVSKRFGKEKIAICTDSFAQLQANKARVNEYTSRVILLCDEVDVRTTARLVEVPVLPVSTRADRHGLLKLLMLDNICGVCGDTFSDLNEDLMAAKLEAKKHGVEINTFESKMSWNELKLNSDGMIPVVVQDYKNLEVLMVAYMNREAFEKTVESGKMTYWSRSRNELWQKGATSGHVQYVKQLSIDCDNDTILAKVQQIGAACHTGNRSCFYREILKKDYHETNPAIVFDHLYKLIEDRKQHPKEGSYTNYLFEQGIDKILKKVGEEATEIIIAAKNPNQEEVKYEMCDFLYHMMVLMAERGITWDDIMEEMAKR